MNMMQNFFGGAQGPGLPGPLGRIANLFQMFNQFRQNPIGALMGVNINIPQNIRNNPEAIVNYLRNSGQMSEEQFNQMSQMYNQFKSFMPKGR